MLTITGLSKRYGDLVAVDDVSFGVPAGRIVGFVGPNGAGKTTTMRSVFGLVRPDRGEVVLDGAPIDGDTLARLGYLPEQRGLYPKMKIGEQVRYFGELKGMDRRSATAAAERLLGDLGLGDRLGDPLEKLSHGNQQRVQLAISMVHDPDLLVLDEPFNGLDPVAVSVLSGLLRRRANGGNGILFSSHQLDLVEEICDDVVLIVGGRVVASGSVDEVRRSSGRSVVSMAVDRPLSPLRDAVASLVGPDRLIEASARRVRVRVDDEAAIDPLLAAARSTGPVVRFRYEPPSLSEVFEELAA